MDDFNDRLGRSAASRVVTAEQIDKRNPIKLSQMLRTVPGLRINDATGIAVAISTRGKNASAFGLVDCVMPLMIDGTLVPENSDIDALMPRSVCGIEVFSGPASIPLNTEELAQG